jgi:hypothetical protein
MQCDRINELNKVLEYNNKGNIFKAIMVVSAGPWVRHRWDLYIHEYKLQKTLRIKCDKIC